MKQVIFFLLFYTTIQSQNTLACLQGIAVRTTYGINNVNDNLSVDVEYNVIRQNQQLSFRFDTLESEVSTVHFSKVGFYNSYHHLGYTNITLDESGEYFGVQDYNFRKSHFEDGVFMSDYFECNGSLYELCGNPASCVYDKVDTLAYDVMVSIYKFSNNNDLIDCDYFFDLNLNSICVEELDIFESIDGELKGKLVRNDLVEKIDTQGDWVQVRYLKNGEIYWTYSSCLD